MKSMLVMKWQFYHIVLGESYSLTSSKISIPYPHRIVSTVMEYNQAVKSYYFEEKKKFILH